MQQIPRETKQQSTNSKSIQQSHKSSIVSSPPSNNHNPNTITLSLPELFHLTRTDNTFNNLRWNHKQRGKKRRTWTWKNSRRRSLAIFALWSSRNIRAVSTTSACRVAQKWDTRVATNYTFHRPFRADFYLKNSPKSCWCSSVEQRRRKTGGYTAKGRCWFVLSGQWNRWFSIVKTRN